MQQAEHITESEVDIEKKKQELYSEIDALGIKSDSRINKLKKFLADRKIWHLEEMDYPLRNSYEQYLRGQIRSQIVSFYLKIYDTVKQQHIYQQMQTLNGKRIYEWKYQNKIYFLKYYPEKEIAETFETSYKTNLLVWDFTQNCSEVLKKQIFYTLSRIIANTSMSKAYRNVRLKSLKLLYDSCVQLNITDIGLLEMEQVETILKNFPETSQRSILGECRRDAFMQQEQIQWEANVWYLERLHLGKHRIDESKSLISISFMEVKEIQNREILQAYMKYELGITGQAVSTIVRRFVCIRNFIELLEQEKILAIHATVAEVKKYADGLRERGIQAKGFNERIFGIGHFYKFMEVKQYITRMPFRIEYFQQKEVIVHHDRSVEETVYMEILKKLYLFPERLRCMFLHLWCLGLRASEVCTLKGNAYYQQGEDYWIQVYQVKMKNYKRIPIPQALYQIMKVYLKKHEIQPEEFIFKNSRGGACLYGTFRTQMIEACRENKIANGEYLFQSHDYRHTVATMFYDSHVSLQSIRDYLGHTYEEMTRQYIDYMPQRIAKANDEFFEMQGSSLASWLKKEEKDGNAAISKIFKSLTVSLITTVSAFLILLFANFILLKQISVFTITGLITVYGIVVLFYPIMKDAKMFGCKGGQSLSVKIWQSMQVLKTKFNIANKINSKHLRFCVSTVFVIFLFLVIFNVHFDDNIKKNGHGVGMSQHGANNLAKQGYNAYQILQYFYKDVKFAKVDPKSYN